jgi:hypothetical protein
MFIQVIQGTVADREALKRQTDRWHAELRPASGYLGSTQGVSADGRFVALVRFESAAAAKACSDRPEQGAWWGETEKCFAGAPSFADTEDVQEFMGGGTDRAGFIQFMVGSTTDRAKLVELDAAFERAAADVRPDILGGLRAWTGPTSFVEVGYFTSEAEARAGEATQPPEEVAALMSAWQGIIDVEFVDVGEPWLFS